LAVMVREACMKSLAKMTHFVEVPEDGMIKYQAVAPETPVQNI